jgi:EAL domain-containing protein (putative c-di-GMP-specific phosphodiesterase class I)
VGVEALVRWQHPQRGFLPPGEFIALAEQTGLIYPLSHWVLEAALRQQQAWRAMGLDIPVAVNLSRRTLHDPQLPETVAQLLKRWDVAPTALVLEITEGSLMADPVRAAENLSQLRALGVHVSIDDFGTGYSSLSYLQMLPVNGLKLAQEFVETLPGGDTEAGLVRTIKDLAETLGLSTVIAEGIERPEQWRSLLSLGYRVGQGFHLAVPMPAERVPEFLSGLSQPGDGDWERSIESAALPAQAEAAETSAESALT